MTGHGSSPGSHRVPEHQESWVEGMRRQKASLSSCCPSNFSSRGWPASESVGLVPSPVLGTRPPSTLACGFLLLGFKAAEKSAEMGNGSQTHG